jgi:hypothetical protein
MNSDSYRYIVVASICGGLAGALVMWNRKRAQTFGRNKLRQLGGLTLGTAASAGALIAFSKALGSQLPMYSAMVMIVITGWAALLHSVVPLPVPHFALRVGAREFTILRASWTGVRLFGSFLRGTPLRHLGGQVYLSDVGRNPRAVLGGLHGAQTVHIWALLLCCPWLLFWAIQGRWMSVACGLVVHALLNVYPILHLRYATGRVEGYVARLRGKHAGQDDAPNERPA